MVQILTAVIDEMLSEMRSDDWQTLQQVKNFHDARLCHEKSFTIRVQVSTNHQIF